MKRHNTMMVIAIYGLNWMKVVEADIPRNCSKDDLDLTAENMCSVIARVLLLTTGLLELTFCTMYRF